MRILYVEDNPANVFLVKRVAKMGQHEIINYVDGNEALRKFDEIDPDLILMDVQLSGSMSGLDVVRALRGRDVTTPVIAVTAYAMVGDKERCLEAGCNDYLAKPLPIPRLLELFNLYDPAKQASTATASTKPATDTDKAATIAKIDAPPVAEATAAKTDEPAAEVAAKTTSDATTTTPETADTADVKDETAQATIATTEAKTTEADETVDTVAEPATTTAIASDEAASTQTAAEAKSDAVEAVAKTDDDEALEDDVSSDSETSVAVPDEVDDTKTQADDDTAQSTTDGIDDSVPESVVNSVSSHDTGSSEKEK